MRFFRVMIRFSCDMKGDRFSVSEIYPFPLRLDNWSYITSCSHPTITVMTLEPRDCFGTLLFFQRFYSLSLAMTQSIFTIIALPGIHQAVELSRSLRRETLVAKVRKAITANIS